MGGIGPVSETGLKKTLKAGVSLQDKYIYFKDTRAKARLTG